MFGRKKKKQEIYITEDEFRRRLSDIKGDIRENRERTERTCDTCKHHIQHGAIFVFEEWCNYPYFYNEPPTVGDAYKCFEARGDEDLCGKMGKEWEYYK